MTKASNEAYFNLQNKKRRATHKELILSVIKESKVSMSTLDMANETGLPYISTLKRVSDLFKEGKLLIVGDVLINGNKHSLYMYNPNPTLFDIRTKTNFELLTLAIIKLTDADTREAILDEYNRLKRYRLRR